MKLENLLGLDHTLVGLRDLEAARQRWQALGFTLCPRGRHIGWGTANYCIMFANDYIELIGIVDPSQFTNNLDKFLEEREGLLGFAWRGEDLAALAGELKSLGVEAEGPRELKRIIELPEGEELPEFRLLFPQEGWTPGAKSFVCKHLTPEMVWRTDWLSHANGAKAVKSLTLLHDSPESLRGAYEKLFEAQEVTAIERGIRVCRAGFSLEIVTQMEGLEGLAGTPRPFLAAMTLQVDDLSWARGVLFDSDIYHLQDDLGLSIPPDQANGLLLRFEA